MSGGRIEGKACVVTGAASGIGRGIATRFAQEGGRVVCVDVNEVGLREPSRASPT
jgi:NAD(P)-dependent dehydrogenase (short-subunit alcohol dehydrogenase family)